MKSPKEINNKNDKRTSFKKMFIRENIITAVFLIIFLGLFVFLVFSVNCHWDQKVQNSFMIAILAFSLIASIYPLIKKGKTNVGERIVVALCFAILIVAIIVFASVAEGKYREPVIQVSSAVAGGMITLYGVGLTIKFNRLEKEKDEIAKAKPNVFPVGKQTWAQLSKTSRINRNLYIREDLSNLKKANKAECGFCFAPIYLANSDLSMCTFKGIGINDNQFIVFQYDNVIQKETNNCFVVDYCFKIVQKIETIQLILGDMYDNTYCCRVSFDLYKTDKEKITEIDVTGVLKTQIMGLNKYPLFKKPD